MLKYTMRKRRKEHRAVKLQRQRKRLKEQIRIINVLNGIGSNLSVKEIHRRTGLTEKNIRKIMDEHPEEITFVLLSKPEGKK